MRPVRKSDACMCVSECPGTIKEKRERKKDQAGKKGRKKKKEIKTALQTMNSAHQVVACININERLRENDLAAKHLQVNTVGQAFRKGLSKHGPGSGVG